MSAGCLWLWLGNWPLQELEDCQKEGFCVFLPRSFQSSAEIPGAHSDKQVVSRPSLLCFSQLSPFPLPCSLCSRHTRPRQSFPCHLPRSSARSPPSGSDVTLSGLFTQHHQASRLLGTPSPHPVWPSLSWEVTHLCACFLSPAPGMCTWHEADTLAIFAHEMHPRPCRPHIWTCLLSLTLACTPSSPDWQDTVDTDCDIWHSSHPSQLEVPWVRFLLHLASQAFQISKLPPCWKSFQVPATPFSDVLGSSSACKDPSRLCCSPKPNATSSQLPLPKSSLPHS